MKMPFKIHFALAITVMSGTLLWLVLKWGMPVTFLFSGEVFTREFHYVDSPYTTIGDSFQVAVNKMFLASIILAAVILPVIACCLLSTDLKTRVRRRLFSLLSLALCLFPISALSVAVIALMRYMLEMGLTTARILGITCGLSGICVIALFLFWVTRTAPVKHAS